MFLYDCEVFFKDKCSCLEDFFLNLFLWFVSISKPMVSLQLTFKNMVFSIMVSSGMIGEGNDTPLQYSCLENPMDGGAW